MQGKQAKMVSPIQERAFLGYLATTRYPARDDESGPARESNGVTHVGDGHRCARAGRGGAPRAQPRE